MCNKIYILVYKGGEGSLSLHTSQRAYQNGAYLWFLLYVVTRILPPTCKWDASPSQDYPPCICGYPFIQLDLYGEMHCESKLSFPKTPHNVPGRSWGELPLSKLYSKGATKTSMYMHVQVYVVTVLFSCLNPGPRQCVQRTCRIRLFSHWFIKNDQSQSLRFTIWSCHLQESHDKVKAGQEV